MSLASLIHFSPGPWQKRLSRGAMVALGALFILLMISASQPINSAKVGDSTIMTMSPLFSFVIGGMGLVVGVLAVVYWMSPSNFFKLVGVILAILALFCLFMSPTGLNHRLVIAPDHLFDRRGFWFSPEEKTVYFASTVYMTVEEAGKDDHGHRNYELRCYQKDNGKSIIIPIGTMLTQALPEVFAKAAKQGVVIGENAAGYQIPPDLRK